MKQIRICRRLSSHYANFKAPNIKEIRQEFRAYGNGSVDFEKIENQIGIIKLNQPEKKNAMSGKMMADFYDIMTSLEQRKDIKGLILTGQGDFFCAGGDLTTITTHLHSSEMGWKMSCFMHETVTKFQTLPMLSVALVHGRALGDYFQFNLQFFRFLFSASRFSGPFHKGAKRLLSFSKLHRIFYGTYNYKFMLKQF